MQFEMQNNRTPTAEDITDVQALLPVTMPDASQQQLTSWLQSPDEFAPVCSVLGGVIANNVVKAVSHSGAPLHNLFYYTLFDGRGVVEAMPPQGKANGQNGTHFVPSTAAAEAIEL